MKKVPYFSKKKLIMAYKAGIREGITSSKYFDNKDFVLEHIQEKYFDISSVSNKLQNDRDVVIKWLDRFKKLPRHLPDICFKDPFIINFIIENKKYDSFNFVESLDFSFQTKENILKSFGKSKDILKPKNKLPKNELYVEYPYQIPSDHPNNESLFEQYHIASWDCDSPPWHKIKKSTTYDDIELKKQALKISPSAAFRFMIKGEISQKEYAQIFIEAFLDNRNIYEFNPTPFSEVYYDSTLHDLKRILGVTQEEFDSFESLILEALFKKTNSINLLCRFRDFFPCFNTISATKKIIVNINFDRISDSQIEKLLIKYKYCEHSLNNPLHPLHFIKEQIGQNKISAINSNSPKCASRHILDILSKQGGHYGWMSADDKILFSDEISRFYKNLDEKVKSSKTFLIEFIQYLHLSNFYNDNLVKSFLDDIVKRTIKYIESKNDFNYLKLIIRHQTGYYFHTYEKIDFNKLFYFNISDKLQTCEMAKYFLIRNSFFLSNDLLSDRYGSLNQLKISSHRRKLLSKVKNDKFFFELVSKKGIMCFEDNLIPNHLLDNKEFMIHSIIKSYKALKFASDRIKSYPSVIKIAYLKNPKSFRYTSSTQKKNKKFLKNIFNEPINIFLNAHHSIKLDKNIYLPALKADISLVSHFTAKKILKIDLKLFNKTEREAIFDEFCQKMGTNDIWELARYKKDIVLADS